MHVNDKLDRPCAPTENTQEQRLHPLSWLFVLQQQLRQFIVPLVALLIFGNSAKREWHWLLLTTGVLIGLLLANAIWRYLTFRYRIGGDGLTLRNGWLNRTVREIPFSRIHNVGVHQNLLHRAFGVAEVYLESAGGNKPEAEMRFLRLDKALALEQQVRHRGAVAPSAKQVSTTPNTLLTLSIGEIVRLGLISNSGMLVVTAALAAIYRLLPRRLVDDFIQAYALRVYGYTSALQLDWLASTISVLVLIGVILIALCLFSVLLAALQYHAFLLSENERRLTLERGLLSRSRSSVTCRRIQSWTLKESGLHRLFHRRSLYVDSAVVERQDQRALRELAPLATPEKCDTLVNQISPNLPWPPQQWQAIPAHHWWRLSLPSLCLTLPITMVTVWQWGHVGWLILLWPPCSALKSYWKLHYMGWSVNQTLVAVRGGWWFRWWRFAEIHKLQALRLERSPLDRHFGTASLLLDTAGATAGTPVLRIAYLTLEQAQYLHHTLCQSIAQQRLYW